MRNLVYLLVAFGVIALGTLIMALRAREPKGFDSGIKAHQRHMTALSPEIRKDSTGIDRVQPVRRVDPLTGPCAGGDDRGPIEPAPPAAGASGPPSAAPSPAADPAPPPGRAPSATPEPPGTGGSASGEGGAGAGSAPDSAPEA